MSSDPSFILFKILRNIYEELEKIKEELDKTRKDLSAVYEKTSSLERYVVSIEKELERAKGYIWNLNARIEGVRNELMSEINETKEYLGQRIENVRKELKDEINKTKEHLEQRIEKAEQRIENVRKELRNEINETRKYLEGKIAETEQRLDQHLAEQDRVLEIHGEGLLSSAIMQLVGTLMPKLAPSTHVVVGQFNSYPLIVVEDEDRINLFCVVKEENQSVAEQIKRLAYLIRKYTGKDVNASIYAMKPREGAPLWMLRLSLAEAPQLVEEKVAVQRRKETFN